MGLNSEDPIKFIKHLLESKSSAKQTAYKHICSTFSLLSDEGKTIVEELKRRAKPRNGEKELEYYNKISEVPASEEDLKKVVKIVLKLAIENDLTLNQKKDTHWNWVVRKKLASERVTNAKRRVNFFFLLLHLNLTYNH